MTDTPETSPRTYPPGVPCWIDTEPADPDAARAFYGALFGWTFHDAMPAEAPGYYLIAQLDGADVAGIGMPSAEPNAWHTYLEVDDADAAAHAVTDAGGAVSVPPPPDAGPGGRAALVSDPQGAAFRLWEPRRRLGVQVANLPGAWNFSDLHTTEPDSAQGFYRTVFGWEFDDLDFGGDVPATLVRQPGYGDHLAATVDPGIYDRQAAIAAPAGFADAIAWVAPLIDGEAPHWHVTFTVADRDAAAERALALGAADLSGPVDTPFTRTVSVRDPQGAVFTMSQFVPGG
jgi:predicted enzyme related to lactoylglutathione lyase